MDQAAQLRELARRCHGMAEGMSSPEGHDALEEMAQSLELRAERLERRRPVPARPGEARPGRAATPRRRPAQAASGSASAARTSTAATRRPAASHAAR